MVHFEGKQAIVIWIIATRAVNSTVKRWETDVDDVKTLKDQADSATEKASPSSGLFGFAGSTLFQPGQKLFKPEASAFPFDPKSKDAKGDQAA
jgi:hypothetical protein